MDTVGGSLRKVTVTCAVATCEPLPHAIDNVYAPGVVSVRAVVVFRMSTGKAPAHPSPEPPPVFTHGPPCHSSERFTTSPSRRVAASACSETEGACTFEVNCRVTTRAPLPQVIV